MRIFDLMAIVTVLAAGFSYVNLRLLRLPATVGLMALSLVGSIAVVLVGTAFPAVQQHARAAVAGIDLGEALLRGMLGFLLFAGALHIDLTALNVHKGPIALLATAGVLISTGIVGVLMWGILALIGIPARFIDCLVFGALISPTDPIAVLGLLKEIGAPKPLEVQIAGESLFNDGVGVAVFTALLGVATSGQRPDPGHLAVEFLVEAVGGAVFGLVIGVLAYHLLKSVDEYKVEILLSLALVWGGYALADALPFSGPIAMVVAGLVIGNQGRRFAMSTTTREHLDLFWELVDEFLNAALFVIIGLEVMLLSLSGRYLAAGLLAIPAVLAARWIAVVLPVGFLRRWVRFEPRTVSILTWGGLRGGISVALALSLPGGASGVGPARDVIVTATYIVVAFSILVQGLTIGPLTHRWLSREAANPEATA